MAGRLLIDGDWLRSLLAHSLDRDIDLVSCLPRPSSWPTSLTGLEKTDISKSEGAIGRV